MVNGFVVQHNNSPGYNFILKVEFIDSLPKIRGSFRRNADAMRMNEPLNYLARMAGSPDQGTNYVLCSWVIHDF